MEYDPEKHHRRSTRLGGYDYAQPGAYFVMVYTRGRACLFGHVVNGEMHLNEAGEIARRCWEDIPTHFPVVELDAFVIMPNHMHGIVVIGCKGEASDCHVSANTRAGMSDASPLRSRPIGAQPGSLSAIVRDYPEFAEFLVKEGIDSVSITPDAVMKVTLNLLNVENKMSLLSEALQIANARAAGAIQA